MRYLSSFVALAVLGGGVPDVVLAQHDPHRNATQAIASGDRDAVDVELAKASEDDPETHFVRMMAALANEDLRSAESSAERALSLGLPFERLAGGPRELLDALHATEAYRRWEAKFGRVVLLHGPMVGAVTDHGASFWMRTARAADVRVVVGTRSSEMVRTAADRDFTAVLTVDGLSPRTEYDYAVEVDGERVDVSNTTFTTFPTAGRAGKFSVAFGGGAGYVPKWESMWDTLAETSPSALLMMGDNVYIDQPKFSLCQDYCYSRRQARPEWRRLVASTAVYAIYDDHDFGTNDCVPGPEIDTPRWKRDVWNRFCRNWVNPAYGGGPSQPGCWFDFHIGDVHFIMLDGRYYRDLRGGSMLGPVQKRWLLDTLASSEATFKIVASPVPWTAGIKPGSKDPWDGFPEEREEIFDFVEQRRIEGVFLIAADRHRTDLRVTRRPDAYDLYEFESSKLTNRHTHPVVATPDLIWGYNATCSFALMRFDTTAPRPEVTFECVTIDGRVVHRHELFADQLSFD